MKYKGYLARVEYDDDDKILVGHIVGIRDIICFHGESVTELETAFHESINDYLEACKKLGQEPNKPYSGKFMLRLPIEVHAAAAAAAEASGNSLNQWATKVFEEKTGLAC